MIKASRFWVREDATNADYSHIDLNKRRPIAQLGEMAYAESLQHLIGLGCDGMMRYDTTRVYANTEQKAP